MPKLKDIIYTNENTGDFSGAGTFRGGPFGFGNRYQLANSQVWPGLADQEDLENPDNPSMWPAIDAQRDPKDTEYDSLESSEIYDSRPHLLPGQDMVRDELLAEPDLEPSYFYSEEEPEYVSERQAGDILYRDMFGWPPMNSLANKQQFIPDDEDQDREAPEEERYNIPQLLPGGREGERGLPFGNGPLNDPEDHMLGFDLKPGDIGMQAAKNIADPTEPDDGLKLNQCRNRTLNRWDETEEIDKGHTNRDEIFNHLVKPVDFIKKSFGQGDYQKELDQSDDVPIRVGGQGVIANPVKHVPGNVNIYKKGNPGYSLGEAKMAKKKQKEEKRELEKYVPEDLDKKHSEETYGNGIGQVMKAYEFPREDRKLSKRKPLEPESRLIPYTYPDKFETIVLTKVFEKLAKLKDKK